MPKGDWERRARAGNRARNRNRAGMRKVLFIFVVYPSNIMKNIEREKWEEEKWEGDSP